MEHLQQREKELEEQTTSLTQQLTDVRRQLAYAESFRDDIDIMSEYTDAEDNYSDDTPQEFAWDVPLFTRLTFPRVSNLLMMIIYFTVAS